MPGPQRNIVQFSKQNAKCGHCKKTFRRDTLSAHTKRKHPGKTVQEDTPACMDTLTSLWVNALTNFINLYNKNFAHNGGWNI